MVDWCRRSRPVLIAAAFVTFFTTFSPQAYASEAELVLPDLNQATFGGISGYTLLGLGLVVCLAGLAFGLVIYHHLRRLPVHRSMLEVSELIYETCKTYLRTQGKFILVLWLFIAAIIVAYFGFLAEHTDTAAAERYSTPVR